MAICRLMLFDYMKKYGRFDENCPCVGVNPYRCQKSCDQRYYSDEDLVEGMLYCKWVQQLGKEVEPFYGFNLEGFIRWARKQLRRSRYDMSSLQC